MSTHSRILTISKLNMQKLLSISHHIDNLNKKTSLLARWSVVLMLGLGLWNVIGRYIGVSIGHNLSSNRLIESQWYLFDLIFLLGMGWTLQKQNHVRVDILQTNWETKRKRQIELIGTIFLLLPFSIGIVLLSAEPTLQSWIIHEASPDPNGLPRYIVKSLIPIGFFLLALQGISEAIKNYLALKESNLNKKFKGEEN